ncbi:uncharacterized protein [Dermacentor albipictus]|uniref:uncharacterized protein n=1 Tax=Dermacentor albipictus TaxID=60249 RepID=UPI0038FCEBDF
MKAPQPLLFLQLTKCPLTGSQKSSLGRSSSGSEDETQFNSNLQTNVDCLADARTELLYQLVRYTAELSPRAVRPRRKTRLRWTQDRPSVPFTVLQPQLVQTYTDARAWQVALGNPEAAPLDLCRGFVVLQQDLSRFTRRVCVFVCAITTARAAELAVLPFVKGKEEVKRILRDIIA